MWKDEKQEVHLLRFTRTPASDSSIRRISLEHSLYRSELPLRRPVQIRSFSIFNQLKTDSRPSAIMATL